MTYTTLYRWSVALLLSLCSPLILAAPQSVQAQSTDAAVTGIVTDVRGDVLQSATINIKNEATGNSDNVKVDAQGRFSFGGLTPGRYTIEVTAPGFELNRRTVQLTVGQPQDLSVALNVGDVSQQVTVRGQRRSALSPLRSLLWTPPLEATSARTYISPTFVQNFTSPVADYGEAVAMAPGTFTLNGNGVGLGQSSTYFRGFPDGNYDIDFDGIPFYDTNTPTHHSWAFFPAQFFGGIDLDRSPGTASTVGPTPFGGSIHLLSKDMSPVRNVRGQFAYGSFNTYLYDGQFDSADVLPNKKLNFQIDIHHLQSDGYQTFNHQTRNAGDIKAQYKISDKTMITGFSGVIWLDANTPNFSATRCHVRRRQRVIPAPVHLRRSLARVSTFSSQTTRTQSTTSIPVQLLPCAHRL